MVDCRSLHQKVPVVSVQYRDKCHIGGGGHACMS